MLRYLAVPLLLALLLSRTLLWDQITFDEDEVRTAMRSYGSPAEIIAWQPTDWPPLYGLLLGGWNALSGRHPILLRASSALFGMLAAACAFRAAMALYGDEKTALGVLAAYSALGYSVFLSTYLRAYIFVMALFPLAVWATVWFFGRPGWRRAAPLAILLAAMFYTTYTAVVPFALIGLYSLIMHPRAVWRWWQPGVIALALAMPEVVRKLDVFTNRVERASDINPDLPPIFEAFIGTMSSFAGSWSVVWGVVFVVGAALAFTRPKLRLTTWALLLALGAPLVLYGAFSVPVVYFLSARYVWWGLFAIALLIGAGIGRLPNVAYTPALIFITGLAYAPYVNERYTPLPHESVFRAVANNAQPGDVMLIDPQLCFSDCVGGYEGEANKFAYYYGVFGDNLPLVESPDGHRRVWYLSIDGRNHEPTRDAVREMRVAGRFFGPWNLLARIYEAPPNIEGVPFANGLRFHGAEWVAGDKPPRGPVDLYEQDEAVVRLWWSVDKPVGTDFSVSVQLHDDGSILASHDGAPQAADYDPNNAPPASVTEWEPGKMYLDERTIALPPMEDPVYADVMLTVYQWADGTRLDALGVNEAGLLHIGEVTVWGW